MTQNLFLLALNTLLKVIKIVITGMTVSNLFMGCGRHSFKY